MSDNHNDHRVLNRVGARQLTESDWDKVAGSSATLASELGTGPVSNPDSILDT